MFFFFQAEDGIRDWSVTGVQTCALPISRRRRSSGSTSSGARWSRAKQRRPATWGRQPPTANRQPSGNRPLGAVRASERALALLLQLLRLAPDLVAQLVAELVARPGGGRP